MGGTSCDVGRRSATARSATRPTSRSSGACRSPRRSIDLTTIGAGGGSIAWIDKGGLLRVGPQSAGAEPGPACYGAGGDGADRDRRQPRARPARPRLLPRRQDRARRAPRRERRVDELGERLGLDATGRRRRRSSTSPTRTWPTRSACSRSTAGSIRASSRSSPSAAPGRCTPPTSRAEDGDARRCRSRSTPASCSAFGALIADLQVNQVWSKHFRSDAVDAATVRRALRRAGRRRPSTELRQEGFEGEPRDRALASACATAGQNYEQDVPVAAESRSRRRRCEQMLARLPAAARAVLRLLDHRRGDRADPLQRHRDRAHRRSRACRPIAATATAPATAGRRASGLLPGARAASTRRSTAATMLPAGVRARPAR